LQARRANDLATAIDRKFWSDERGLLADDLEHTQWSEHMQCMAILGGLLSKSKLDRIASGLLQTNDLARCTVYFEHYLFETFRQLGRIDRVIDRMGLWFDLKAQGFKTTIEQPEPSRSDCHAWGAHPLFHYLATICGIRPAAPGLARVEIRPQLGPLTWAKGTMQHPGGGMIAVDLRREGDRIAGTIDLPAGISGVFVEGETRRELKPGHSKI
jgi:alpha-L-rhamnosidase